MTVSIQHHQREEHYQAKYQSLSDDLKGTLEETCPGIGISHILIQNLTTRWQSPKNQLNLFIFLAQEVPSM